MTEEERARKLVEMIGLAADLTREAQAFFDRDSQKKLARLVEIAREALLG